MVSFFSANAVEGMKRFFRPGGAWDREQDRRERLQIKFDHELGIDVWPTQTKTERDKALEQVRIARECRRRRLEECWPEQASKLAILGNTPAQIEKYRGEYFAEVTG